MQIESSHALSPEEPTVTRRSRAVSVQRSLARRRLRAIAGLLLALVALACFTGGATLLRPPRQTHVVAVGASYAHELGIPHNAYGWSGLKDLCGFDFSKSVTAQNYLGLPLLTSVPQPLQVTADFDWKAALSSTNGRATVLMISMHGASDERGPYFLAGSQQEKPHANARLYVTDLLDALGELPAEHTKLLLIDVTTQASFWQQHIPINTFAAGLKSLESQIASIPKLSVICSSDDGQKSWVDLRLRRTCFARFISEGLRGLAEDSDHDGRLSALEIFDFTQQSVRSWAESNCRAIQSPVLLPSGQVGRLRANEMTLVLRSARDKVSPFVEPESSPEPLVAAWERASRLKSELVAPESVAPLLWRRYLHTTLRYEQFLLAGDAAEASQIKMHLDELSLALASTSRQQHEPLDPVENYDAEIPAHAKLAAERALEEMWRCPDGQVAGLWRQTLDSLSTEIHAPFRDRVYTQLLARVMQKPTANLRRAADIIRAMDEAKRVRPSAALFVAMLSDHLPRSSRLPEFDATLRLAMRCRMQAARVLSPGPAQSACHATAAHQWIKERLGNINRDRCSAEDQLFASPARVTAAHETFQTILDRYQNLRLLVVRLQSALATRDHAFTALPFYGDWATNVWLPPGRSTNTTEDVAPRVAKTWDQAHALASLLSGSLGASRDLDEFVNDAAARASSVESELRELEREFRAWRERLVNQSGPDYWNNRDAALRVPTWDPTERLRILAGKRRTSSAAPGQSDAHLLAEDKPQLESSLVADARRNAAIAVASLGDRGFTAGGGDHHEFAKIRLEVNDSKTNLSQLVALASKTAARRTAACGKLDQQLRSLVANEAGKTAGWHELAETSRTLLLDGSIGGLPDPQVEGRLQNRSRFSIANATRVWQERWNGDPDDETPYFRLAAETYLSDAKRWWPEEPNIDSLSQQFARPFALRLIDSSGADLPSVVEAIVETSTPLSYRMQSSAELDAQGVTWVSSSRTLQLLTPETDTRILSPIASSDSGDTISVEFQPVRDASLIESAADPSLEAIDLSAFFRGHVIRQKLQVRRHSTPRFESFTRAAPQAASVAIKAKQPVLDKLRQGHGGVVFLLDASGSMGATEGGSPAKYQAATTALVKLLKELPKGVQASVWVYGEAVGPQKTATVAEDTIRRVMRPIRWDPSNDELLAELSERLSFPNVEPWNESPIGRAILRAQSDLASVDGYRSIVVVTDGVDNRFESDLIANPQSRPLGEVLPNV